MLKPGIIIALFTFSNAVFADACMLESTQKNFPNKSCMQNSGTPAAIFNDFCGGAADEDHTVTKVDKCPPKSLATCTIKLNGVNGTFIQYIYTASLLPMYKMVCSANPAGEGVWKQN